MPPTEPSAGRWRGVRYAAAIALVVIGVICGAVIPGTTGGTICTVLAGAGLIAVVSFIFYDVGLTEDRERARRAQLPPRPDGESPAYRRSDDPHGHRPGGDPHGHRPGPDSPVGHSGPERVTRLRPPGRAREHRRRPS
jgi:hypothetical protein